MSETITRRSPIHERSAARRGEMVVAAEMLVPQRLASAHVEAAAIAELALCDLSFLPKLGLKGRGCADWLGAAGISVPTETYATADLDDGGLVVRLPGNEFLLESGPSAEVVPRLAALEVAEDDVFRVPRQEATLVLIGRRAEEVLAQTCGINFAVAAADRVVLTRVAGVSCTIWFQRRDGVPSYRMWVDYTYAAYLWDVLEEIGGELGGAVVGAAAVSPELG
ncbi:MAG: hypothetical protein DWQ42_15840 [Planctomycetota bacterium]|nr:MAG: hypothetical protein DWQ42_15840 [Planctomycetota bacterium]